ncbi:hypothetical protein RUM44_004331 [Polyplax serrata]|uniref:Uncharacterized protein n=1 Tax=Polyplax serrata TaxID=468196 RepID=A0ABR1B2J1_POLSC
MYLLKLFTGGVHRTTGESGALPLRWPLHGTKSSPKVNSLIYKDYTLVQTEDGGRSYVSPEMKTQLLVEGKIKALESEAKSSPKIRESMKSDSNSDSGYEVPINVARKDKGDISEQAPSEEVGVNSSGRRSLRRHSYRFSEVELHPEDDGKINLPFYMAPLDTRATLPTSNQTPENKKEVPSGESKFRKRENSKSEPEFPWNNFGESNVETSLPYPMAKEKRKEKVFSLKPSFWGFGKSNGKRAKNLQKSNDETQVKELMLETTTDKPKITKTRFSFPWKKEDDEEDREKSGQESNELDKRKSDTSKQFAVKLPKWSWKRKKDQSADGSRYDKEISDAEDEEEISEDAEQPEEREEEANDTEPHQKNMSHDDRSYLRDFAGLKIPENLEAPIEIFPEETTSEKLYDRNFNFIESCLPVEDPAVKAQVQPRIHGIRINRYSADLSFLKNKRSRHTGKIDPNPLKKMFGIRAVKSREEIPSGSVENTDKLSSEGAACPEDEEEDMYGTRRYSIGYQVPIKPIFLETSLGPTEPSGISETNFPFRLTNQGEVLNMTGQVRPDFPTDVSHGEYCRSDTESADHGSTDKSSMSKLTNEKQPKKLMNGLFGSFRKGKSKRGPEVDFGKTSFPFEVTVKEPPPSEVQVEVPRTEGIVYAELDMTRAPPGNVMRREDEKTEYAEILYPTGKAPIEAMVDEMRKSRENLVSSRENLAEPLEEVLTTTITPDGKKEAAV